MGLRGLIDWRVVGRLALIAVAFALIRIQFWFFSMADSGQVDWFCKGLVAPLFLAAMALVGLLTTFGRSKKRSRSEAIMENARKMRHPKDARRRSVVSWALSASVLVVVVVAFSFSFIR